MSGVTDHLAADDLDALRMVRSIVATLAPRAAAPWDVAPAEEPLYDAESLYGVVPTDLRTPYDVREVIARIVDGSRFAEFKAEYGPTLVTGFARVYGHPVGIVANNGILFSESAMKGAHFIELCDQRRVPLVFLQNITGFMVGTAVRGRRDRQARGEDGHRGLLRPGAQADRGDRRFLRRGKLRHVRAGVLAQVPVHVAERADLGDGRRAGRLGAGDRAERPGRRRPRCWSRPEWSAAEEEAFKRPIREQYESQGNPYYSTARLWDDGVIDPVDTRRVLGLSLSAAANAPLSPVGYGVFRM